MIISYSVIQSEKGAVGYPKKFNDMDAAQKFFDDCKGGAIFAIRVGEHEFVYDSKGLEEDAVRSLMGWDN